MFCTVIWVKKSPTVESSTWLLNSHNCSENHTKSKKLNLKLEETEVRSKDHDDIFVRSASVCSPYVVKSVGIPYQYSVFHIY